MIDVLGLGAVAVDDLLYVALYPPVDSKTRVQRRERHCGGMTGTALVAAARAGARCAYAGVLGNDALSQFVEQRLHREGVDTAMICRRDVARPIHSTIVVDECGTRTIFYSLDGVTDFEDDWPLSDVVQSARVLLVDYIDIDGMVRAARIARAAGIPVVADLEIGGLPRCLELLPVVDHLVVSRTFAHRVTGEADPRQAVSKLWHAGRQAVVVTDGASGSWYCTADEPTHVNHQPAFSVSVVDTTGCGDVFHGAYAAAIVAGNTLPQCVLFATAAAALKATRAGGQDGIPTRDVIEAFLEARKA